MKRLLTVAELSILAIFVWRQSVYMHEVTEEAGKVGTIALWDIICVLVALILGIFSWRIIKVLSKLSSIKIILTGVAIAVVFITGLISAEVAISKKISEKKVSLHEEACLSFLNCIQEKRIILEKDTELLSSAVISKEVYKEDYGKYDEYLKDVHDTPFDHSGQGDGVYYCYHLEYTPYLNVYYYFNEKNPITNLSEPSLCKCSIFPCYIRYFKNQPNPAYDVKKSLLELYQDFAIWNTTKVMENVEDSFKNTVANEYFWIGIDRKKYGFWERNQEIGGPNVALSAPIKKFRSIKSNGYEVLYGVSEHHRLFVDERGENGGFRLNGLGISEAEECDEIGRVVNRGWLVFGIAFLLVVFAFIRKICQAKGKPYSFV